MQRKEFFDVDALPNIMCGKHYQIMDLKDTVYIMIMMKIYETLENLEG